MNVTSDYTILSFYDAFFRYNQILIDHPKTVFITNEGILLKNIGATYQRMMNKVFKDEIERNLKVYVDDMLIKSKSLDNHFADLEKKFIVMKQNKVRINLTKCAFRVTVGKFMGFMLTKRRIEVNLAK